jgi:hypothetical protein
LVGRERAKDALREAEQRRLVRSLENPRPSQTWMQRLAGSLGRALTDFAGGGTDDVCCDGGRTLLDPVR